MTGNSDVSPNQNFEDEYREATTNCSIMRHLQTATVTDMNMISNETDYSLPVPLPPSATPVEVMASAEDGHYLHNISTVSELTTGVKVKFENLETDDQETLDMDTHMSLHPIKMEDGVSSGMNRDFVNLLTGENGTNFGEDIHHSGDDTNDSTNNAMNGEGLQKGMYLQSGINGPKTWSQQDMDNALDALRNHNMSLTKASATYGIPSTTLWQRAHRLGIDTPKKEGPSKSWSENNLHNALQALRTGTISANKASKAYGIPSSTLYKIARREGIRLAAPFNAAPTTWRPDDLERALESIRSGLSSVQRASTEFGIPTGTLYGRCKREGIELSRSNPTPWSEDAMNEALDAVRVGQMSINQAAIHFNLPYSSLYGRIKRCKFEIEGTAAAGDGAIVPSQNPTGDPMVPALIADPAQHSAHIPHNMHMSHPQHNMLPQELHYPTMEPHLDAQGTQDDYSRRFYSVYHHSLTVPSDDHTDASHLTTSNHDCISTS